MEAHLNDRAVVWSRMFATLASALALLALGASAPAQASFGGLGALGTAVHAGSSGESGEVNSEGQPALAADPKTGNFFIADRFEDGEGHLHAHIQEFGPTGTFLGQESIKLGEPTTVKLAAGEAQPGGHVTIGGLAVDPEASGGARVYLLLLRERPNELEAGHELRNPEALSAADIYAFSTAVLKGKLTGEKLFASEETLKTLGEGKAPLLFPRGIAVDPKTHDVVLVGRENESSAASGFAPEEAEFERTAVQRVDPGGKLGPRYIDAGNCLYGAAVAAEPQCAADDGEWGSSPVVSAGGHVLVQDYGNEIWEIPATATAEESFKEVQVVPRHLYTVVPGEEVGAPLLEGEQAFGNGGGSMSLVAGSGGEGRIYLDASYAGAAGEPGKAVAVLDYSEAGATPAIRELGWTAGQPSGSEQAKCVLSLEPPMIAGTRAEGVLALDIAFGETSSISVMKFGPGGEACGGEPEVSTPSAELAGQSPVTTLSVGDTAAISSNVTGAHATSVVWKFRYREAGGSWTEEAPVSSSYALQTSTLLEHTFSHLGEYEVLETVNTDDLGFPQVSAEPLLLQVVPVMQVAITPPGAPLAGRQLALQAQVTDRAEASPEITYVLGFGDGNSEEGAVEGTAGAATITAKHTYASAGKQQITLTVTDAEGNKAHTSLQIEVGYPPPSLETGAATAPTQTTATLNATVNPEGSEVSACRFEYGTSTAYGQIAPCASLPGSGTNPVAVSAVLTGLSADTNYHFRIIAGGAGGTAEGSDGTFTTPAAPPPPSGSGAPPSTPTSQSSQSAGTLASAQAPPVLSDLGQSHARWRAGSALAIISGTRAAPLGTVFSFALSEQARVSFTFAQKLTGRKVAGRCVAQSAGDAHGAHCARTLARGQLTFSAHAGADTLVFEGRLTRTQRLAPGSYVLSVTAEGAAGGRSATQTLQFTIVK